MIEKTIKALRAILKAGVEWDWIDSNPAAVVVPVNVIQEINEEKVVYTAEPKGKHMVATRKVITVQGVYGNRAEVKGLEPGDKIITVGYQGLNDGDYIKI